MAVQSDVMNEQTQPAMDDSSLPTLGPLERQVLALLWQKRALTVREAQAALTEQGTSLAYTTVMARLFAKGLLSRTGRGKLFVYQATIDEESFRERSARALAGTLVQGYGRLAIATFVEELAKVGPERLKELRELADRTARKK